MTRHTFITALMLCCTLAASAQNKKKARTAAKPAKTVKAQKTATDGVTPRQKALFDEMTDNTQRLFVIDSTVVDRGSAYKDIPLSADLGLTVPYNSYFNDQQLPGVYVYVNGFQNKCYYAVNDSTGRSQLFCRNRLNGQWGTPQPIKGIDTAFRHVNHPFMASDGETLYFSAQHADNLGGYDLYMTRYDSDEGQFLAPENMGLPYNSFADDLMFVADDINHFAWLVTNRQQPEGKVCVYTISTSDKRVNYDVDDYDDSHMQRLAQLWRIRDTWVTPSQRDEAMQRLQALTKAQAMTKGQGTNGTQRVFVISDKRLVTDATQLGSQATQRLYEQWLVLCQQRDKLDESLDGLRTEYHNAKGAQRAGTAQRILTAEKQLEQTLADLESVGTKIRQAEGAK